MSRRLYNETFLNFGFSIIVKNDAQIPQCVICYKTLTNESMKPSKLREHFVKLHPELVDKGSEYLKLRPRGSKERNLIQVGLSDRSLISLWRHHTTSHCKLRRTRNPILLEKNLSNLVF